VTVAGAGPPAPEAEPPLPAELERPARKGPNWLGWGLAAFVIASCFLFVDLHELVDAVRRLSAVELALLVLLSTTERFLRGCNWAFILRIVDVRTPLLRVVRYFYQGSFSGVFLPSHVGGDILRAWWVMRDSGVKHPVFASLVVERLIGFAAAVNWAILGGAVFASHLHPEGRALWVGLAALAFLGANLGFALVMSRRLHDAVLRRLGRFGHARVVGVVHKLYEAFARFARDPRRLALNALLAVVLQGLQMLLFLGIALSIDATTPAGVVPFFAAAALHGLILKLPIAPDGWGVGELTAIAVYGLVGVGAAEAFAVSAVGHVVPMLALAPGFLFLLAGDRRRLPPGAPAPAPRG
jgi:glycosyltransferase 2 family protein